MIFNSFSFIAFILPVLVLYWGVFKKSATYQNSWLLITSLIFYGWADWRFLILLVISILVNYFLGIEIHKSGDDDQKRNLFLYTGLFFNIGQLLYFKYFNFFYEGFYDLLNLAGVEATYSTLQILLPLGISFFTFQTLGYLIDVYNEEIEPNRSLLEFSVFISFFPKILSGPIERATTLIPQLQKKKTFNYDVFVDGLRQILWGLFAKVVIAENCAVLTNIVFDDYQNQPASTLLLGTFFYAIQLYADFSGYSNMAIGIGKLFGIQLMRNFSTPFFSTNIADFWRSWHMSLTNWMMDYVFTPLSFILRRYQKMGLLISIVVTFVLVGFWHGANWTFIVYGLFHGIYFIPLIYVGKLGTPNEKREEQNVSNTIELLKMMLLFIVIMITDVFFRSSNVFGAFDYLRRILSTTIVNAPGVLLNGSTVYITVLILLFFCVEWMHKEKNHDFEISKYPVVIRWSFYIGVFVLIFLFGRSADTFIYFQF